MSTKSSVFPVAIVGGGASGTILAVQLARKGVEAALIDGSGRMGRGVAYSTAEPVHLLNVRAEGMSALAGEPEHFVRRFEAEGGNARGFAERRLFGQYLGELLEGAVESGRTSIVHCDAVGAEWIGEIWIVSLKDGRKIQARALALATGNQEPESLPAFANVGARYIANPWGAAAKAAVSELAERGGNALLVGTGLTMVDLVLSLDAAGHKGEILALSRRGLIPRAHAEYQPVPVDRADVPAGELRSIWRWLRKRSRDVGWRAAIDSLRPHSQALWESLDASQQKRFLRHARPWWDVHRHRIAPQVAEVVHRLVSEVRLQVVAGRVLSARATGNAIEVEFRRRGAFASTRRSFSYIFNCTGPLHAIERTRDPLLRSLFDGQAVRSDQLGIGLDVDARSRAGERLWALGPLSKGRYWEIIAVPDIREQAALVAEDIARELQE